MSDFKIMNDPLYDDSYPMKLLEQAFEMQVEQAEKQQINWYLIF